MSITYQNIIQSKFLESIETTQYQVPTGRKCVIDKVTLTNPTATKATVSIYIVPNLGTFGNDNVIVKTKDVYPSQTVQVLELSSHVLESQSSIIAICSSPSTVNIRASGREIV